MPRLHRLFRESARSAGAAVSTPWRFQTENPRTLKSPPASVAHLADTVHITQRAAASTDCYAVRFPAVSTPGSDLHSWHDDLSDPSGWFDRLHAQAAQEYGPDLGIRREHFRSQQIWRRNCEDALDQLLDTSPIHRVAVGGGDWWRWPYWPQALSRWLAKQMYKSTKELWASEDGAALMTLSFGAKRQDVRQLAAQRLRELKQRGNLTP